MINDGRFWPAMQPTDHQIELIRFALKHQLYRTIGRIADPAMHAVQMRMSHRRRAETHALNLASDPHIHCFLTHCALLPLFVVDTAAHAAPGPDIQLI